ncbi:MAG: AAA family ATPase [Alphaproteobacteria bacterium]
MKIQKFNRINARTFKSFPWPTALEEFLDFNLIYGWNGSGKTTLSDIMHMIEKRLSIGEDGISDFSFVYAGRTLTNASIVTDQSPPSVRVFNKSFIEKNVFADGGATPIFFIGEENIEKQKDLDAQKEALDDLKTQAVTKKTEVGKKDKELADLCQSKASEVRGWAGITSQNTYNKSHFSVDCEALITEGSSDKHLRTEEQIASLKTIVSGTAQPKIDIEKFSSPDFSLLISDAKKLLQKTVVSQTIEALTKNEKLADWVKEGVGIHKDHKAENCQFCEQKLPAQRLKDLEGHFNDEYIVLDTALKEMTGVITATVEALKVAQKRSPAQLYPDLIEKYQLECQSFDGLINQYIEFLLKLSAAVEKKKGKPFEGMSFDLEIPNKGIVSLDGINGVIAEHNVRTDDFNQAVSGAKQEIRYAKAAECIKEYETQKAALGKSEEELHLLEKSILKAAEDISVLEQEIIEHKKPAEDINKDLKKYLGHSELEFTTGATNTGYNIMRGAEPARALSEGEKTAIALLHFLKTLEDRSFDIKNGIVVIDDPVCSLDDTALFYAFSFIKERTKSAKQLFILTHNFSFFRQVKNWFTHVNRRKKKIGKEASFYQTVCSIESSGRVSRLQKLDPLLLDYESEYQYLFSLTYKASLSTSGGGLEQYYHMPNVARRLLEAFLAFRLPGAHDGLNEKLESLTFDTAKKTRIIRFLHVNSHDDHVSEPEHDTSILSETPQILADVMELIESEDKKHYDEMMKLLAPPTSQSATGTGGP